MSASSALSSEALSLSDQLFTVITDLRHKKNALVLASDPESRQRLCNQLIEELVNFFDVFF
jgi:hypothetical protein